MKKSAGFTLIEVITVIVIIGILSTIGVISFNGLQVKTRDDTRISRTTAIAETLEKYFDKNGEYPQCESDQFPAGRLNIDSAVLKTPSNKEIVCSENTGDYFVYGINAEGGWSLTYKDEANDKTKSISSRHSRTENIVRLTTTSTTGGSIQNNETTYSKGATATIQARPDQLYLLARWEGDCSGATSEQQATIIMNGDKSCNAIFKPIPIDAPTIDIYYNFDNPNKLPDSNVISFYRAYNTGCQTGQKQSYRYQLDVSSITNSKDFTYNVDWIESSNFGLDLSNLFSGWQYSVTAQSRCYNNVTTSEWSDKATISYTQPAVVTISATNNNTSPSIISVATDSSLYNDKSLQLISVDSSGNWTVVRNNGQDSSFDDYTATVTNNTSYFAAIANQPVNAVSIDQLLATSSNIVIKKAGNTTPTPSIPTAPTLKKDIDNGDIIITASSSSCTTSMVTAYQFFYNDPISGSAVYKNSTNGQYGWALDNKLTINASKGQLYQVASRARCVAASTNIFPRDTINDSDWSRLGYIIIPIDKPSAPSFTIGMNYNAAPSSKSDFWNATSSPGGDWLNVNSNGVYSWTVTKITDLPTTTCPNHTSAQYKYRAQYSQYPTWSGWTSWQNSRTKYRINSVEPWGTRFQVKARCITNYATSPESAITNRCAWHSGHGANHDDCGGFTN